MKVVTNVCYGGYSLSEEAYKELGLEWDGGYAFEGDRSNPELVAVVEKLGERANGRASRLEIIEIPDGVEWWIAEHDGKEWVEEAHRKWGWR
jgi:hypothetical protein